MAAAGIGNVVGAVLLQDFGAPQLISVRAQAEIISGGVFVAGSTATGVVSSGTNSFATADVRVTRDASGENFIGIAMHTIGSNAYGTVATAGVFILQCVGSVFAGQSIECDGNNSIQKLGSTVIPSSAVDIGMTGRKIGRALTAGASGGYAVALIRA